MQIFKNENPWIYLNYMREAFIFKDSGIYVLHFVSLFLDPPSILWNTDE